MLRPREEVHPAAEVPVGRKVVGGAAVRQPHRFGGARIGIPAGRLGGNLQPRQAAGVAEHLSPGRSGPSPVRFEAAEEPWGNDTERVRIPGGPASVPQGPGRRHVDVTLPFVEVVQAHGADDQVGLLGPRGRDANQEGEPGGPVDEHLDPVGGFEGAPRTPGLDGRHEGLRVAELHLQLVGRVTCDNALPHDPEVLRSGQGLERQDQIGRKPAPSVEGLPVDHAPFDLQGIDADRKRCDGTRTGFLDPPPVRIGKQPDVVPRPDGGWIVRTVLDREAHRLGRAERHLHVEAADRDRVVPPPFDDPVLRAV